MTVATIIPTIVLTLLLPRLGETPPPAVALPPPALVASLHLSTFYRKHASAHGLPVLSSAQVSDYAVLEAAYLIDRMLDGREDIRRAMIQNRVRFVVMSPTEMTTAVPEYADLTPSKYWDKRARGLGATRERPVVSCGEENLLGYPGDPYAGENILVHEFGHAIHEMGLRSVEPGFDEKLRAAYDHAMAAGLWKGTYAATNPAEYWGEGVQSWFDCNQAPNAYHNRIRTREQLKAYDSELARLMASIFRDNAWRYQRPDLRADKAHLAGFDPAKAPRFTWDPALLEWYRKYEEQKTNGKDR